MTSAAGLMATLRRARFGQRAHSRTAPDPKRLDVPAVLRTSLGYDAVGLPDQHGHRVMDLLPRVGCVFADRERWWWIVPSQSDVGVHWPSMARYSVGAFVADSSEKADDARRKHPRLIHWPTDTVPYTHPLMLYMAVCTIAGTRPAWPHDGRLETV
jgi:hypothetical protein